MRSEDVRQRYMRNKNTQKPQQTPWQGSQKLSSCTNKVRKTSSFQKKRRNKTKTPDPMPQLLETPYHGAWSFDLFGFFGKLKFIVIMFLLLIIIIIWGKVH